MYVPYGVNYIQFGSYWKPNSSNCENCITRTRSQAFHHRTPSVMMTDMAYVKP